LTVAQKTFCLQDLLKMVNKENLLKEFQRIKALGFVQSLRSNNTGIGFTFEYHLGITENNKKNPDFEGIEVKSQRARSNSYVTIFTKSPSFPAKVNATLTGKFGTPDKTFPALKVLHTSCFGNCFNSHIGGYSFGLKVDRSIHRVLLQIKSIKNQSLESTEIYWTFEDLRQRISDKLRAMLFVRADSKKVGDFEYFHYTSAIFYLDLNFDKFLKGIEDGLIMFDIRIGAYKTLHSKSFGKPHDHGSCFRIRGVKLELLFEEMVVV